MKFIAGTGHYVRASKGEFLASGASGILELLPSGDVVKSPWPGSGADDCRREITTEYQIYKRLGQHRRLVRIIDWDPEHCVLTMEHMPNGNLKEYILVNNGIISIAQRLQWAQQAAEGLHLLHIANVIHCDVEPKNFLLDANLNLKIADFSGSSLEGSRASACIGKRFSPPDLDWRRPPRAQDDLFGLGSTIYYIMTGQHPFQELSSDEVEDNYRTQKFPDVSNVMCGSIITRCWYLEVTSAQEIYDSIKCLV
jgi:serine/threonine protein kinase